MNQGLSHTIMVHKRKVKTKWKRRSKICTYRMNETNPKTYRYLLKKDGMPSGASPSLDAWVSLNIYLGCLGHPQAWDLASPPSSHVETSSIFDHFIHIKLNKKLGKICLYNKANHYSKYCCKPIHNSFLHCSYCNITFPWLIPPIKIDSFIKTSKTMHQK